MKWSYRKKLFSSFVFIFSLFTVGIFLFEYSREKAYKTGVLIEKLDAYTEIANAVLTQQGNLDSTHFIFPENLRLTLIDLQGNVVFDNRIKEMSSMENHSDRPEIVLAQKNSTGSHVRKSTSNNREYIYYARRFHDYYLRVALPYSVQTQNLLKPDRRFIYYLIGLFVVILIIIHYASGRFGRSIQKLKDFSDTGTQTGDFPEDELGEIGQKIAENYRRLDESKKAITFEHEKLLQHVHSSEEGICFFAADQSVEFYNGLFIHYLNTIIDEANSDPSAVFSSADFENVQAFLSNPTAEQNYFETKIEKQAKLFAVRVMLFENNSFEIVLNDITRQEKPRQLKQEMTGNITHELRTPVTGIRGCLETILENQLDAEKERRFIQNAYRQTLVLSELIQDLGLLTKIEDAPSAFGTEAVNMQKLIADLHTDLEYALREKNMAMTWDIPDDTVVVGNQNLLHAIFRNLCDNAIRYAGTNTAIHVKQYGEDSTFYHFSFADNGVGIPDERHLNRLFERFYRISEGRTRDTGGSGLGLSIVKNAVAFHKGTIAVKNRADGGLEFLFTLRKGFH